ncbi:MAG: hypothetical protein A2138_21465 [Deltaproteobacteria bacterium RBG_16_71_12]|nr:MAG: hypothetical protein A2138_21465 [Deltaproteobacteria bacterium RBG_16_71_12]
MKLALATVLGLALLPATLARAQLAVVPTHADDDPVQSWLVGAVVEAASSHWQMLSPQLLPGELGRCPANDVSCLGDIARRRGASHLLIVGVAPLGARDAVVSAQLFAVGADRPLFEGTVVQPGDSGDDDDGRSALRELIARLVATRGPPPARPRPAPAPVDPPDDEPGALGMTGMGALGAGAVGVGVTTVVAALQFSNSYDYRGATSTVMIGGGVSGVLLLGGIVLLTIDSL